MFHDLKTCTVLSLFNNELIRTDTGGQRDWLQHVVIIMLHKTCKTLQTIMDY